jgi:hypothetical protein
LKGGGENNWVLWEGWVKGGGGGALYPYTYNILKSSKYIKYRVIIVVVSKYKHKDKIQWEY